MGEVLDHLRRLLGVFGKVLEKLSPWEIPWPFMFALVFPILMAILALMVWWSRGKAWPVHCEYPLTTTGHSCRNRVFGEWQRCHLHRPGRQRRNGRTVRKLLRWQTIRRGSLIEREDIRGRGFVRDRTHARGLLYYRGFARPLRNVIGFVPTWFNERREDIAKLIAQLRVDGALDLRALFTGAAGRTARSGVSSRLPQVLWATRLTLILVVAGLVLVGFAASRNYDPGEWHNYIATFAFIAAWTVARWGIWAEATDDPPSTWREHWLWLSISKAVLWFSSFVIISVVAGNFVDKTEKTFGLGSLM
ncbi:hypothetical protein [Nocardia huaxiensis]|uniref:hypothetical protein n=1 Tax=Nocardia huaxiensis TaxID=2755382 RepID=UPI001E2A2C0B|nr:hypothetical protein [Nocardia huaxiensis]UFS95582.1 hypothetical protein LPY97_33730 [Nocardia huaxiensis]